MEDRVLGALEPRRLTFLSPRQAFPPLLVIRVEVCADQASIFSCCVVLSFYGNSFKSGEFAFSF